MTLLYARALGLYSGLFCTTKLPAFISALVVADLAYMFLLRLVLCSHLQVFHKNTFKLISSQITSLGCGQAKRCVLRKLVTASFFRKTYTFISVGASHEGNCLSHHMTWTAYANTLNYLLPSRDLWLISYKRIVKTVVFYLTYNLYA